MGNYYLPEPDHVGLCLGVARALLISSGWIYTNQVGHEL